MKKLVFILSGLITLNVYAVDPTQGPLQQDPALCGYGYNPNCNSRSIPSRKIIQYVDVYIPSKYGALAMNISTGISGGALNMNSLAEAKKEAIKTCEMGGKNAPCKIVSSIRNGCIAVAQGELRGKIRTFYAGKERGFAESDALNQCKKSGAKDCNITVPEGCSLPDGM